MTGRGIACLLLGVLGWAAPAAGHHPSARAPAGARDVVEHRRVDGRTVEVRRHGDALRTFERLAARKAFREGGAFDVGPVPNSGMPSSWCGSSRATDDVTNEVGPAGDPKVHVVYAVPSDVEDRLESEVGDMIQTDVKRATERLLRDSNGTRHMHFDLGTSCGPGYVDITTVRLRYPTAAYEDNTFYQLRDEVRTALSTPTRHRNFLIYPDQILTPYGGQAEWPQDDRPGPDNYANRDEWYATSYFNRWYWEASDAFAIDVRAMIAMHEVAHNLGAVQVSAPHSTQRAHCWDEYDVLCYDDGWGPPTEVCPYTESDEVFDCGGDDYFNPSPQPGSYLDTHWNTFDSVFMCPGSSCRASAPGLSPQAPTIADAAGGDGDGRAEPGETVTVDPSITNVGGVAASSVTGGLTSSSAQVSILDGQASYGSIAAGATRAPDAPFAIAIGAAHSCGTALPLGLRLQHSGGRGARQYRLPVGETTAHPGFGLPVNIPDDNAAGVQYAFPVDGAGTIADLDVELAVTHPSPGDITIKLRGPDGTERVLVDRGADEPGRFDGLSPRFDDEASQTIADGHEPYDGSFKPLQALSAFDGRRLAGTWQVTVADRAAGGTGALSSVTLRSSECTSAGDGGAPAVEALTPPDAATGVASTSDVVVRFSEAMNRTAAQAAFSLKRAGTSTSLGGAFTWNAASTELTFDPSSNLVAGGDYVATVSTGARDAGGTALEVARRAAFTVIDGTAPTIPKVVPASGATNVPGTATVAVTFSEVMDRPSVEGAFSLRRTDTGAPVTGAISWAGNVMSFDPIPDLPPGVRHTATVSTAAKDRTGRAMASARVWSFTTDLVKPRVTAVLPANGATNVQSFANVAVTFSEPMDQASAEGAFALRTVAGGTPVPGSFRWEANKLVFDPADDLRRATKYTATVTTMARDRTGNPLYAARTFTFTVWNVATPPPAAATALEGAPHGSASALSSLHDDDGAWWDTASTTTGTRTTAMDVTFRGVPASPTSLKLFTRARNSRSCSQTLSLWNWTTGAWTVLGTATVGVNEVQFDRAAAAPLARWVSGTDGPGDVRVRLRCTHTSAAFVSSGELVRISHAP